MRFLRRIRYNVWLFYEIRVEQRKPFEMDIPCNYEGFKFFNVKFYPDEKGGSMFHLEAGFKYDEEPGRGKVISMEQARKNFENKEDYCWLMLM